MAKPTDLEVWRDLDRLGGWASPIELAARLIDRYEPPNPEDMAQLVVDASLERLAQRGHVKRSGPAYSTKRYSTEGCPGPDEIRPGMTLNVVAAGAGSVIVGNGHWQLTYTALARNSACPSGHRLGGGEVVSVTGPPEHSPNGTLTVALQCGCRFSFYEPNGE